ncbi:hypothetical protein D3C73_835270 [compost metagenome]
MQADSKESQHDQQWQVFQARQGNTCHQGDAGHERRGNEKADQRQMTRLVSTQADADADGGVGPAEDHENRRQGDFYARPFGEAALNKIHKAILCVRRKKA